MTIPNSSKNIDKENNSYIADENVKQYSHSRKQFGNFLKNIPLNTQLPYYLATVFLDIYPRKMKTYVHITLYKYS